MRRPSGPTPSLLALALALVPVLAAGCSAEPEPPDDGFTLTHLVVAWEGISAAGVRDGTADDATPYDTVVLESVDGETWTAGVLVDVGVPTAMLGAADVVLLAADAQGPDASASRFLARPWGSEVFESIDTLELPPITGLAFSGEELVAAAAGLDGLGVTLASSTGGVDWQTESLDVAMAEPRLFGTRDGELWVYGDGPIAMRRPLGGGWEQREHGLTMLTTMATVQDQTVGLGWTDTCPGQDPGCIEHELVIWNSVGFDRVALRAPPQPYTDILAIDDDATLLVAGDIIRVTGDLATGARETVWSRRTRSRIQAVARFGDTFFAAGDVLIRSDDLGRTWSPVELPVPPP